MPKPSQKALDLLKANPDKWQDFKEKFGALPDGFAPPAAPQRALDLLTANPDKIGDFESKYGYRPTKAAPTPAAAPVTAQATSPVDIDPETGAPLTERGTQIVGTLNSQTPQLSDLPSPADLGTSARAGLASAAQGLRRQSLESAREQDIVGLTTDQQLAEYQKSLNTDSPLPYPTGTVKDAPFYGSAAARRALQADPEFVDRERQIEENVATGREITKDQQDLRERNPSLLGRGALSAAASLPQSAAAMAVGIATKNPLLAAASMAPGTQGSTYNQLREEGVDPAKARGGANISAAIEVGTELLPFTSLLKKDKSATTKLAKFLAAELPGESIATVTQTLNEYLQTQPDNITVEDVIEGAKRGAVELPETWVSTLIMGGTQSGLMSGVQAAAKPRGRKGRAIEFANDSLESLGVEIRNKLESSLVQQDALTASALDSAPRSPQFWDDVAAEMVPAGSDSPGAVIAQRAYASTYGRALASTSGKKMPQSLAIKYAQTQAETAANNVTNLTAGLIEGTATDNARVRAALSELPEGTLESIPAYKAAAEKTDNPEEALHEAFQDPGFAYAVAHGALNGLDGKALDQFIRQQTGAPSLAVPVAAPEAPKPEAAPTETAKVAEAPKTTVLSEPDTKRLGQLEQVATSAPIEPADFQGLVDAGLAKTTTAGKALLTPKGRRARVELQTKQAEATAAQEVVLKANAESKVEAAPKAEPDAEVAPKTTEKTTAAPVEKVAPAPKKAPTLSLKPDRKAARAEKVTQEIAKEMQKAAEFSKRESQQQKRDKTAERKKAADVKRAAQELANEEVKKAEFAPGVDEPNTSAMEDAVAKAKTKADTDRAAAEQQEADAMTEISDLEAVIAGSATAGQVGRLAERGLARKNDDGTGKLLPAGRRRMLELRQVPSRSEKNETRKAQKAGKVKIEESKAGFTLVSPSGEPITTVKTRAEADELAVDLKTETVKTKAPARKNSRPSKPAGTLRTPSGEPILAGARKDDAEGTDAVFAASVAQAPPTNPSKGIPRAALDEVVAEIGRDLNVQIRVADSDTDPNVPTYIRDELARVTGTQGLFYKSPTGETEVWLIRENLSDRKTAIEVAIHESVGHLGLRAMLGPKRYDATMRQIRKSFPREVRSRAIRNQIKWNSKNRDVQERRRNLAAEELVAYATARSLTLKPNARALSVWDRIADFFRGAARSAGLLKSFSVKDVDRLILRARDYVRASMNAGFNEQTEYEGEMVAAQVANPKMQFKHFSNLTEEEVELNPAFQGTGFKGRESVRKGPQVTSLYPADLSDAEVEKELQGKTKYVVEVPEQSMYDASEDKLGLRQKAQKAVGWTEEDGVRVPNRFIFDMNRFEELIREAGFTGYHTPAANGILRGQGRLFKPIRARRAESDAAARVDSGVTHFVNGNIHTVSVQGGGSMTAEAMPERGMLWVKSANIPADQRGAGLGVKMAQRLAQEAYEAGLKLVSDNRVSDNAARVYDSLARRGYSVKRNPARLDRGTGELISASELRPVFEVTGGELAASVSALKNGPLLGMAPKAKIPGQGEVDVGPFALARKAADAYRDQMGIDTPEVRVYARVNPEFAQKVAKAFDKMKHEPNSPRVKAAYAAMIQETLAQYQAIKATGLKVELITGEDPYKASPRMAIEDVKKNNHLWIFPTEAGYGQDKDFRVDNPMLAPTAEKLGGRVLLANDVFRIVHDYFGHIQEGNGFRADGEENAWRIHAGMYSDIARQAMTTETRGQNSWVNFGPNGDQNQKATTNTVYAPQKIGLLPKQFWVDPAQEAGPKLKRTSTESDEQSDVEEEEADIAYAILPGNTGDPVLDSFLNKFEAPGKTLRQHWDNWTTGIVSRLEEEIFDDLAGIKNTAEVAGIDITDSGFKNAHLARSAAELTTAVLEHGPPLWIKDGTHEVAGIESQKLSFLQILKPLGSNVDLWGRYMVAKRAKDLKAQSRENLFTDAEITKGLALGVGHPEFDVAAAAYAALNKQVLDFAEYAGRIDPAARALWENQNYIPFYRVSDALANRGGSVFGPLGNLSKAIQQLRGGQANLGDPIENIVKNWYSLLDGALKAHAARTVVDAFDGTGLVVREPKAMVPVTVPVSQIKEWMKQNPQLVALLAASGIDVAKLPASAFAGIQQMFAIQAPTDPEVVNVWRNGKREYWRVHDEPLLRGLMSIPYTTWGPWMEIFRLPKRIFTATTTSTPQFQFFSNPVRDMFHSFVVGAVGRNTTVIPILDTAKGILSQLKQDQDAVDLLSAGGSFTHGYVSGGQDKSAAASYIRRTLKQRTGVGKILNTPAQLWRMYRELGNAFENSNRVSIYKNMRKAGASRLDAAYEARDVLDFSKRGANLFIRFLVESAPFWNARLQGLYRLGRSPGGKKKIAVALAIRGMLLTTITLGLGALFGDDDRYKELTSADKVLYWNFWVGEKHFKIPKPFEVGSIFGTVPEVMMDYFVANAKEPDRAKQAAAMIGFAATQSLNMTPDIQAVMPLFELSKNYDFFAERPILNVRDLAVLPSEQDGPSIHSSYRLLSRLAPELGPDAFESPKQLQHLARGYIGGLQDYILIASDMMARRALGEPEPAARGAADIPGLRTIVTSGPPRSTKYTNTMYTVAEQAAKLAASIDSATELASDYGDARVEKLEKENPALLDVADDFKRAIKQVRKLQSDQRDVQLDPAMSPEEKRKALDENQTEIGDIAKQLYDLRPGGLLNPETASLLIGAPEKEQLRILEKEGLPATARLLRDYKVA